ncbi:hypothetical protein AAMO2058_001526300 [Amorphochlora amoebiformis]
MPESIAMRRLKTPPMRLVVMGESMVGKTSMILRYMGKAFQCETTTTNGIAFWDKNIEHRQQRIRVQIWDTAGIKNYRATTYPYYRRAEGVLLVYDITDSNSLQSVNNWIDCVKKFAPPETSILLAGNKLDIPDEREVERREGKALASRRKIKYIETSAKTGENIDKAFGCLIDQVLRHRESTGFERTVTCSHSKSSNLTPYH